MKAPIFFPLILCLALAACGGSESDSPPSDAGKTPPAPNPKGAANPGRQTQSPSPATNNRNPIEASDEVKAAATKRLELLQQITKLLLPPEEALGREAQIEPLFAEYNGLGQMANEQGIKPRLLHILTTELAPDEWPNIRSEFDQARLRVRSLGEEQQAMMDRVMAAGITNPDTPTPGTTPGLEDHIDKLLKSPAPAGNSRPERTAE